MTEKIIIPPYAKSRAISRNISITRVRETIKKPDILEEGYNNRFLAKKQYPDEGITVAYSKKKDKIIVITVYWNRYIRPSVKVVKKD